MGLSFLTVALLAFSLSSQIFAASELKLNKVDQEPNSSYRIQTLAGKYGKDRLVDELRNFVESAHQGRVVGTKAHDEAFNYLEKRVKALSHGEDVSHFVQEFAPDLEYAANVYEQDFKEHIESKFKASDENFQKWRRFTDQVKNFLAGLKEVKGRNLIWEKKGSINSDDVLMIAVNYDTISLDSDKMTLNLKGRSPGADDNGSGVAIALGMIEVLSQIKLPKTVRIAFFDFQEFAALGSRAYVSEYAEALKALKFAGVVNLLMLGHDSKFTDETKKEGNMKAYIRNPQDPSYGADKLLADGLMKAASKVSPSVRYELASNNLQSSDHVSFWHGGFPAIVFTGDWENDFNPRNHTADDFVETINQKTFHDNFKYALGAVVSWAYDIVP